MISLWSTSFRRIIDGCFLICVRCAYVCLIFNHHFYEVIVAWNGKCYNYEVFGFFLGESHKLCTIVIISGFMQCRLAVIVWLIDICSIFNKKFPVFHISCEMQLFILKEMYEFTSAIVRGKHRKPLKKNFSVFLLPSKYHVVLPLRAASCNGVLPNVVATPTFAPFLIKRSAISTLPKWILNNEHSFPTKTTI